MNLTLETERLADNQLFGLHSDAITFETDDGVEGRLVHTFGLGGGALFLSITVDGKTYREMLDARVLLQRWADAVVEEVRG